VTSSPLHHQNNATKNFPIWTPLNKNFWLRQWSWVNNLMVFKKAVLVLKKCGLGLIGLDLSLEKIGGLGLVT